MTAPEYHLIRAAAALRAIPEDEIRASEPLVELLVGWLRAGQSVGPIGDLDALEVAAVIEAGRRLETERLLSMSTVLQGPWGRASIASEIDGGQELDELAVMAVCSSMQQRMQEATHGEPG